MIAGQVSRFVYINSMQGCGFQGLGLWVQLGLLIRVYRGHYRGPQGNPKP